MKLTKTEIKRLHRLGWDFLPNGPNEWEWMKFDKKGNRVATDGS